MVVSSSLLLFAALLPGGTATVALTDTPPSCTDTPRYADPRFQLSCLQLSIFCDGKKLSVLGYLDEEVRDIRTQLGVLGYLDEEVRDIRAHCRVSCGRCPAPSDGPTGAPAHTPTNTPTVTPTEAPTHTPTVAPTEDSTRGLADAIVTGPQKMYRTCGTGASCGTGCVSVPPLLFLLCRDTWCRPGAADTKPAIHYPDTCPLSCMCSPPDRVFWGWEAPSQWASASAGPATRTAAAAARREHTAGRSAPASRTCACPILGGR